MVKITATLNTKEKRTQNIDCQTLEQFKSQIQRVFNVDPQSIKIMRPPTRDAQAFLKNLKEGMTIFFMGNIKKQKDKKEQEIEKKKIQQKIRQRQQELQQQKLDDHKKMINILNKNGIRERDFSFMNEQGVVEDMGTDHYTSLVHLLRIAPQFKRHCIDYEVQPKNPDGLIIQQLGTAFKQIDGKTGEMVNPLQFCSAFIAYCADDIQYPFPSYDFNYTVNKIFDTVYNAYLTESERKQPNSTPSTNGPGAANFGTLVNLQKTKITPLDEDDFEVGLKKTLTQTKYILECDLSDQSITSIQQGIKKRFEQKNIWQNFYAFDLEYKQKIINIQKPSKYIFVHFNRVGYPIAKDESEEIVLLPTPKSTHKVRLKRTLDLSDVCSNSLNDKLQNGKFQRYQLFYPFGQQQQFKTFIQKQRVLFQEHGFKNQSLIDTKYHYFDQKLLQADILDDYYFQHPLKGSKQTGQYRLIGCVYHKGPYYHHPDPQHTKQSKFKHDMCECRGEFMVMIYKQNEQWLRFHKGSITKTTLDEATSPEYWGGGQWTPVLGLYRQIYIKNIEIEYTQ